MGGQTNKLDPSDSASHAIATRPATRAVGAARPASRAISAPRCRELPAAGHRGWRLADIASGTGPRADGKPYHQGRNFGCCGENSGHGPYLG
jgi:hypothetical protein